MKLPDDLKQYTVDAFADQVFTGNPAAVCVLDTPLSETLMQSIAHENNLSETAYAVKRGQAHYDLRWFTPTKEIDLCGHATLATAFVVFRFYEPLEDVLTFETESGTLKATRSKAGITIDLPCIPISPVSVTQDMVEALGVEPVEAYLGRDLVCVLPTSEAVETLRPDMLKLGTLDGLAVHVTAQGTVHDCVTRSFAPKLSVEEDPVCGSGHCHVVPYWMEVLGKTKINARQASHRGGTLQSTMHENRVFLTGNAVLYAISNLFPS